MGCVTRSLVDEPSNRASEPRLKATRGRAGPSRPSPHPQGFIAANSEHNGRRHPVSSPRSRGELGRLNKTVSFSEVTGLTLESEPVEYRGGDDITAYGAQGAGAEEVRERQP